MWLQISLFAFLNQQSWWMPYSNWCFGDDNLYFHDLRTSLLDKEINPYECYDLQKLGQKILNYIILRHQLNQIHEIHSVGTCLNCAVCCDLWSLWWGVQSNIHIESRANCFNKPLLSWYDHWPPNKRMFTHFSGQDKTELQSTAFHKYLGEYHTAFESMYTQIGFIDD